MEETLTTTNKAETRDAETVLTDENATVDELMNVTTGNPNQAEEDEHTTVYTSGTSIYDEFNLNPRDVEVGAIVIGCVSLVIALIVFFAFTMRKKAPHGAFLRRVKEFLNFRKVWIAGIIKFVYLFLALSLTIGCIVLMFFGGENELKMILLCLFMLVFGNVSLRIGFEMTMILIGLWENTNDMRAVLVKKEEEPEEDSEDE